MSAYGQGFVATAAAKSVVKTEQLKARDAVFVYDETDRHPSSVVAVYVFDARTADPVDSAAAVQWVRSRLGCAPLFQRRLRRVPLDLDLPYWVPDPGIDLAAHVVAGAAEEAWEEVRLLIGEIAATRVDLTRPPWQLHLFDRVRDVPGTPGPATVLVVKFHHSACDGVATRELELRLFGGTGEQAAPMDTRWSAAVATLRAAVLFPYRTARFVTGLRRSRDAAAEIRSQVAAGLLHEPMPARPAVRFNRDLGRGLAVDYVTVPLPEVAALRSRCTERVTVNDIMLTVVSGALAAYLEEQGEMPSGSLAAMVPMSMRGVAQWDSANQLCQMAVDLHTDLVDPRARLAAIRESVRRERRRNSDPSVLRWSARVETSPAWLLRLAGWARARRSYSEVTSVPLSNTTISNVPPVGAGLAFLGAPLLRVIGVLPVFAGDGLRHVITSQGDELVIAFSTDPAMMPDTARYRELLLRSLGDLATALG